MHITLPHIVTNKKKAHKKFFLRATNALMKINYAIICSTTSDSENPSKDSKYNA